MRTSRADLPAPATRSRARPSSRVRCRDSCRSWHRLACWARTSCPPGRRTPSSSPRPRPSCWPARSPRPGLPLPRPVIAELDVVLDARGQSAAGRLAELDAHTPWQSSRARFVGTAAELTELLVSVLETADGVRLHPAVLDVDLEELAQLVLPALRRRGVLGAAGAGFHLPGPAGPERPASRYAAATATESATVHALPRPITRERPHDSAHIGNGFVPSGQLQLGIFFQGVNSGTVWKSAGIRIADGLRVLPPHRPDRGAGLFAAFFLGEGLRLREHLGRPHALDVVGRPDAQTMLAALASVTTRIGLVATQNTTYNDPADLAHRLSSLDLLSGGRAAWNVVTTDNAWTGANFRRGGYLDHADRYVHAEAFVNTAKRIWDSWEDGAIAETPGASAWAAPGSARPVHHEGKHYTVDYVPRLPRSAQYRPVLFQAGDSPEGRDFAARQADVIFSAHPRLDDALDFRRDIVERTVKAGRGANDVKIMPASEFILPRPRRKHSRRRTGCGACRSDPSRPSPTSNSSGAASFRASIRTGRCRTSTPWWRRPPRPAAAVSTAPRRSSWRTSGGPKPRTRASASGSSSLPDQPRGLQLHGFLHRGGRPSGGVRPHRRRGRFQHLAVADPHRPGRHREPPPRAGDCRNAASTPRSTRVTVLTLDPRKPRAGPDAMTALATGDRASSLPWMISAGA
jgi:alkanesulfonate monooxygenase SsuD/methylene tetrahydromethanopterin reductase-like flavin-dependent oxidoreductase (luciferase family)